MFSFIVNNQAHKDAQLNQAITDSRWRLRIPEITYALSQGAIANANHIGRVIMCRHESEDNVFSIVYLLMRHSVNLNIDIAPSFSNGRTLLSLAVCAHNMQVVQYLVSKRANPNVYDNEHKTPLVHAIENKNDEIAQLLIKAGANVNIADNYGTTPLMLATRSARTKIVALLMERRPQETVASSAPQAPESSAPEAPFVPVIAKEINVPVAEATMEVTGAFAVEAEAIEVEIQTYERQLTLEERVMKIGYGPEILEQFVKSLEDEHHNAAMRVMEQTVRSARNSNTLFAMAQELSQAPTHRPIIQRPQEDDCKPEASPRHG